MRCLLSRFAVVVILFASAYSPRLQAQSGESAWLRYVPLAPQIAAKDHSILFPSSVQVPRSLCGHMDPAQRELVRGMQGMLGQTLQTEDKLAPKDAFILGTLNSVQTAIASLKLPEDLKDDGYWLTTAHVGRRNYYVIAGANDRGVLYGVFAFLGKIAMLQNIASLNDVQQPFNRIRSVDEWDNLDGTIERGYGGRSIFFENGEVRADLTRAGEYARLLASVGINGCTVNNVNADPRLICTPIFSRNWRESPTSSVPGACGLPFPSISAVRRQSAVWARSIRSTRSVAAWWNDKVDEIYRAIPDFAGLVVKADSEGRAGPVSLRPHARRRRQRHRARPRAARRIAVLSRLRLQPSSRLAQSQDRPRARRLRHLSSPRRQVRRQRSHADQVRPHRFSGARAGLAAVRRPATRPTKPSNCRSRRNTRASSGISVFWRRCGSRSSISTCARTGRRHAGRKISSPGKTFHRPTGGFVGVANVGRDSNWLGSSAGHGESLRLRPAGVESRTERAKRSRKNGRG